MDDARCAGVNVAVFYPNSGDKAGVQRAKAICGSCPVRRECLAWAVGRREMHGVWGGMTRRERLALARQARAGR
ncbi:WhiB family transcriptional regulator [Mycobacterium sp. B14F4]|uniref:WhiB family transcriptional regulator n=1 Tax=Mycobacterium sp. B14F4 TaxID=3153565 RepID=UPI00325F6502